MDLLVEDWPDLPHITHCSRLNPLSHTKCSLDLLLLSSSCSSTSTSPTCSIVLGRQWSLGKGWVYLGKQLVIVTLLLMMLWALMLWLLMLWKMMLLLRMQWWLLMVPLLLVGILYMLLLLLMKLLLMELLLLLLELHLLLLSVLLLLLCWVGLERSLLCLLPLLKLHTEAIFRCSFRRFFMLLKMAGSIDWTGILVPWCPRVLTMVS